MEKCVLRHFTTLNESRKNIIILVFCIVRFTLDIYTELIPATYYVLGTLATLFIDAIEFKSRRIALVLALSIMLMNIFGYLVTLSDDFARVMEVEVKDGWTKDFGLGKNYLAPKEVKAYIYFNMFTLTFGSLVHIIVDKDLQKLVFVYGRVFRPNLRHRQGSANPVSCLDNKRWGAETGIILSICCCLILYVYDYIKKSEDNPLNEDYVFCAVPYPCINCHVLLVFSPMEKCFVQYPKTIISPIIFCTSCIHVFVSHVYCNYKG